MTSKEFTRRCDSFAVFENAADIFCDCSNLDSIYKFSAYGRSLSSESYAISLHDLYLFLDNLPFIFDLFYVERFSRSQFLSQYKYFLSFLSRLSDRQMSLLISSRRFDSLLKFKDKFNSMKNTAVQDA